MFSMGSPDEFLNAAVDNVRAFNDATSVHQLFDRALTADEAYGILDTAEILANLMPQVLIQLSLAVGQSLAVASAGDVATVDAAVAPLAAAAANMAQAAHLIRCASENINPLLVECLDDTDTSHWWHTLVATVRGWTAKAHRAHQAA